MMHGPMYLRLWTCSYGGFLDAESSIAHATDGFPQGESSSVVAVHDVYDADRVPSSLQ